jgi:hypothetical protein
VEFQEGAIVVHFLKEVPVERSADFLLGDLVVDILQEAFWKQVRRLRQHQACVGFEGLERGFVFDLRVMLTGLQHDHQVNELIGVFLGLKDFSLIFFKKLVRVELQDPHDHLRVNTGQSERRHEPTQTPFHMEIAEVLKFKIIFIDTDALLIPSTNYFSNFV